jgi:hypothetical protein
LLLTLPALPRPRDRLAEPRTQNCPVWDFLSGTGTICTRSRPKSGRPLTDAYHMRLDRQRSEGNPGNLCNEHRHLSWPPQVPMGRALSNDQTRSANSSHQNTTGYQLKAPSSPGRRRTREPADCCVCEADGGADGEVWSSHADRRSLMYSGAPYGGSTLPVSSRPNLTGAAICHG